MGPCKTCASSVPSILRRYSVPSPAPKQIDPLSVEYDNKWEKWNASGQLKWGSLMEEGDYRNPSLYRKVKVLLISWNEESDDLKTKSEVDELENVFTNTFGFHVTRALLDNQRGAHAHNQVNLRVATLIHEEDDPHALLIVYYAGHGKPGHLPGSLELTGKRNPENPDRSNAIVWNHVESALQNAKADVLQIFDCCYAGDLGGEPIETSLGTRSFEFLGACSSGSLTRAPGDTSFTNALIRALQLLAKEQGKFTVSQLAATVRAAPNFPEDQVPVFFERGVASIERIVLAPLSDKNADQDSASGNQDDATEHQSQGLLTLNFVLGTPPSDDHLDKIAHALKKIIHQKVPIKQVVWGGLNEWGGSHRSPSAQSIVIQAANKFTARRRQAKRKEESLESLSSSNSLTSQDLDPIANQEDEGGAPQARKRRSRTASLDQVVLGSNADPSRARRRVHH